MSKKVGFGEEIGMTLGSPWSTYILKVMACSSKSLINDILINISAATMMTIGSKSSNMKLFKSLLITLNLFKMVARKCETNLYHLPSYLTHFYYSYCSLSYFTSKGDWLCGGSGDIWDLFGDLLLLEFKLIIVLLLGDCKLN